MGARCRWLAAAAVVAAIPVQSAVAATWSAPTTLGPTAGTISDPGIAFGAAGQRLVSAGFRPPTALSPGQPLQSVTRLFAGTAERAQTHLVAPPVAYGARRAAYLRQSPRDKDFASAITLGVSLGDIDGHVGRFHLLSRRALAFTTAIAANRAGVVAAAWAEPGRVRLSIRRPGGGFGRPVTVATGAVGQATAGAFLGRGVAVAVGGRGDVVVAYQRERGRSRTIEARLRRSGARLGRPQRLGPQRGLVELSAAMAPGGRAVVAWGTQDAGEEANEAYSVYAAVRPAGAGRFGAAQVLDPGGPALRADGRVALGMGDDGSAAVAWSSPSGSYRLGFRSAVRVSTAAADGRFSAQRELAPSGAVGDVAVGPQGAAIVAWTEVLPEDHTLLGINAAVRPAGASDFGAPEAVSPRGRADDPTVAFDPRTGQPVVAWAGSVGPSAATLQVAERSG